LQLQQRKSVVTDKPTLWTESIGAMLSYTVLKREPNASHMCVRIKFHTYNRQYKYISETIS
jgi:hypothetical protein